MNDIINTTDIDFHKAFDTLSAMVSLEEKYTTLDVSRVYAALIKFYYMCSAEKMPTPKALELLAQKDNLYKTWEVYKLNMQRYHKDIDIYIPLSLSVDLTAHKF